MRIVDADTLQIKTVEGAQMRVVPLVVRGPQRRQADIPLSDGLPIKLTFTGTYDTERGVLLDTPHPNRDKDRVTVYMQNGDKSIPFVTVDQDRVKQVDRRSGIERRVAP